MRTLIKFTDTFKEVLLLYLLLVVSSTVVLAVAEGIGFFDALWLAFVTSTSTGYGDIAAKTVIGRVTSVLLMHLSLFLIAPLIVGHIIKNVLQDKDAFTNDEQEEMKRKLDEVYRILTKEK